MPEVVISNTSPIFYLHRLRLLDLLQKLYQEIIVPKAVVAELEAGRRQGEDVPAIDSYEWIKIRAIRFWRSSATLAARCGVLRSPHKTQTRQHRLLLHVEKEMRACLECGILAYGFVRVRSFICGYC